MVRTTDIRRRMHVVLFKAYTNGISMIGLNLYDVHSPYWTYENILRNKKQKGLKLYNSL